MPGSHSNVFQRAAPGPDDKGKARFRQVAVIRPDAFVSMDAQTLKQLIEQGLPGAIAQVYGADGVHFEARVTASAFAGKPTLARHRMVYATLGERMGGEIHALALKTMTPEEAGLGTRDPAPGKS